MREAVFREIFLDLQKGYDALDRDGCLNILVGYGVVPKALRILRTFWGWVTMVMKSGEYYAPPPSRYSAV